MGQGIFKNLAGRLGARFGVEALAGKGDMSVLQPGTGTRMEILMTGHRNGAENPLGEAHPRVLV